MTLGCIVCKRWPGQCLDLRKIQSAVEPLQLPIKKQAERQPSNMTSGRFVSMRAGLGFQYIVWSTHTTRMDYSVEEEDSLEQGGPDQISALSSRTSTSVRSRKCMKRGKDDAHDALLLQRYYTVSHPDSVAPHHIGQHHVSRKPVAYNSDLTWTSDTSLRILSKVLHNLKATAGFLRLMRKHGHICGLFKCRG